MISEREICEAGWEKKDMTRVGKDKNWWVDDEVGMKVEDLRGVSVS